MSLDRAAAFVFFAAAFVFLADPVKVGDFWWHLNSGRWIWEHAALPAVDPFTFTVPRDDDLRRRLILDGYWLSQSAIYLVYRIAGFAGVVLARALFFCGIFWVVWRAIRMRGVDALTALLLVAPLPLLCTRFVEARPQAVSFLAMLLLFMVLERGLESLRAGRRAAVLLWSPVILLLWANAHRGYPIGLLLLGSYVVAESWRFLTGRHALVRPAFRTFLIVTAVAAAAAFVNPVPTGALVVTFRELGSPFVRTIDEFLPPWEYVRWNPTPFLLPGLLLLLISTSSVLLSAWRRLEWRHAFLFAGFAAAALRSFRFSIFFILMSVVLASGYLPESLRVVRGRGRQFVAAGVLAFSLLLVASATLKLPVGRAAVEQGVLPERAADFILAHRPPEPLYNPFEWGGYLSFRLYPDYRLFVDSRNLDAGVLERYMQARERGHRKIFDEEGINSAIFYPMSPGTGRIPTVVLTLLVDATWDLVHVDDLAVVFVRARANPGIPAMPKATLERFLQLRAEAWVASDPGDARPHVVLGALAVARGDLDAARAHFEEALRLDPGNPDAIRVLDRLR